MGSNPKFPRTPSPRSSLAGTFRSLNRLERPTHDSGPVWRVSVHDIAYPQSPLTDYAQLAIGLNLSQSFSDYSVGRTRSSQPNEALDRLRAVDRGGLPDVLKARLGLGLARAYIALDRTDDAREAIDAAIEEVSGQPALREMIQSEIEFDSELQRMN